SVPFNIKKVKDVAQKKLRDNLIKSTNYDLTPQQEVKRLIYESKAFDDEFLDLPLERPNPLQTWKEFKELYETFMALNGNAYIYLLSPDSGMNAGEPLAWYLLPSHLTQIVLKSDVNLLGVESPVDYYILTQGDSYIEFENENVVHIKYANPNFDMQGSHLYGQAPLRASLKNIQSSNTALDLNIKTLNSSGAFGFIHGKSIPLTKEQADEIKSRLKEMDSDTSRLGNIQGMSAELGFTQVGMSPAELKLFEFLNFDTKQVCNVLGWSDKLLNNDSGAKYDNVSQFRKQVITDTILPDLQLLDNAINAEILPRYKKYSGYLIEHDVTELPEMQQDTAKMMEWLKEGVNIGLLNRNEARLAIKYNAVDDANMDEYTVASDILTLDQAVNDFPLNQPPVNEETI
ncbi:MAG: phage portal protein, partial [Proteobacteria bacterium]|nr:phage portal protein [Pseudomonadota bacterium]